MDHLVWCDNNIQQKGINIPTNPTTVILKSLFIHPYTLETSKGRNITTSLNMHDVKLGSSEKTAQCNKYKNNSRNVKNGKPEKKWEKKFEIV